MYDIAIIGGGIAGLTAAIYGQRAGKSTIIFEKASYGGQIVGSSRVENYPGFLNISGSELALRLLEQAKTLGAVTMQEEVLEVQKEDAFWIVKTMNTTYKCRSVILAVGMEHRNLEVSGEERLKGSGVSYCATCDGMFYRGRDVAVVGGGNTALEDANFLSDYCKKVYLIHRRDTFRGDEETVARLAGKGNVEFVLDTVVEEIFGGQMVEGIRLWNQKQNKHFQLQVSGVFVAVGQIPQNELFSSLVELDEAGFVVAGEDARTNTPGIFAAGDCRAKNVRQLTTAAADGTVAALAAATEGTT